MYQQFSVIIGAKTLVVKESLEQAQNSMIVNEQLAQIVQELKGSNPDLQIYAMSNISRVRRKSELEHTTKRNKIIFKPSEYKSALVTAQRGCGVHVGMQKPDLYFFEHATDQTGCRPNQVVVVDDQAKNICAAQSPGIYGLVVDKDLIGIICQTSRNLFQDLLARAEVYKKANAGTIVALPKARISL